MAFNNVRRHAIPLPKGLKDALRQPRMVRSLWTRYRERQVVTEYRARREHYALLARERGLRYSLDGTRELVRQRLAARGYTPLRRRRGEVHTFASFPGSSWHPHLLPDLHELGPVTYHDYQTRGFAHREFDSRDLTAFRRLEEMSEGILPLVRAAHAARPIDWVFFYGGGHHVSPVVVRRITEELGIPVVNMSLDDKQGWAGAMAGPWRSGAIDLTREFDLFMTSARVACDWHLVEGGRPVYLPEGFNASAYAPRDVPRDLPVSFVGAAYGFRYAVADELRRYGVPFHPYGAGWPSGYAADVVEIFNRSVINLGMGGIEYSEELTNVKGRDFEIPGTGGGVYLTSYNPDLAQHFTIGEEILCYANHDEMVELIRYYLARPDEAQAIAARGRARSLREHRWLHRYETMLELLGIL
ncbi:MAG: hypothetical protein QOH21_363 [Acidobacteriota bacterium]|jgi:hypothetical protein|nr:hypothetical protein [Acidobacteriota bacterium]